MILFSARRKCSIDAERGVCLSATKRYSIQTQERIVLFLFWHTGYPQIVWHCYTCKGISKNKGTSGIVSWTQNLADWFSAFSPRFVDRQLSSTVASLSHWASTFVLNSMFHVTRSVARLVCDSWEFVYVSHSSSEPTEINQTGVYLDAEELLV